MIGIEEISEREQFISIMIIKCGLNPELMIRKVE